MPPLTVPEGISALVTAVKSGDLDELDNAITSWSADRELKNILTDALVISCAYLCQEAAFHLLARPDIDPNSTSELIEGSEHVPPLVVAVAVTSCGRSSPMRLSIVERLIERGALVDVIDNNGWTALHHAVAQGNTNLTRLLLEKDANGGHVRHCSPFYLACAKGEEAIVELLLSKHANAEAPTEEKMRPLHVAAAQGYCSIVELLLRHNRPREMNASCMGGWSPLHLACAGNDTALIYSLARAGQWNLFAKGTGAATTVDRSQVVNILLSHGADVNQKSNSWKTALHLAAVSGDANIICLLLGRKEIYTAAKDHQGNTPLLDAVEANQSREIIDLLVPWSYRALPSLPPLVRTATENSFASIVDFCPSHFGLHRTQQTIFDLLYTSRAENREITKPSFREEGSFRWIHLPANNMSWCHTLITRWFFEGDCRESRTYLALVRSLSQQQHQGPKAHSIHMRPTFNTMPVILADGLRCSPPAFMYIPYFELDTIQIPEAKSDNHLSDAYDSWKANDHCHHRRRTLDQFWYKSLDTDRRDGDQVMSRYLKTQGTGGLLVVDQLWIWVFEDLIITSFPHVEQHRLIEQSALFTSILERINQGTGGLVRNVSELAGVIIERCISAFDRSTRTRCNADYFDVFKFSATAVMEAQIRLFREFQETSIAVTDWIKGSLRKSTANPTEPLPFVEDLLTLRREIDLLVEARDIEDELGILKHILDDQTSILHCMQSQTGWVSRVPQTFKDLETQKLDIPEMIEWMQGVSASITDLLEHKQRYANAIDANFAREQTKSAEVGNRTLLVFTIVTIIFAPMSFLAAFFAINTQEVPQNFKREGLSGLDVVYRFVVGLGLGTAGFIILVALSYQWVWAKIVELWEKHTKLTEPLNKTSGGFEPTKTEQANKSASGDNAKSGSSSSISRLSLPHRRDTARRDVEAGEGSSE